VSKLDNQNPAVHGGSINFRVYSRRAKTNPVRRKKKVAPGKVVLARFFWGHPKGTKGRITSAGDLILKGSPPARVRRRDEGDLFRRGTNPSSKRNFSAAELRAGIKVEMEHTKSKKVAQRIATDHLREIPNYYTRHKKCFPEEYRKKHNPMCACGCNPCRRSVNLRRADKSAMVTCWWCKGTGKNQWSNKACRLCHGHLEITRKENERDKRHFMRIAGKLFTKNPSRVTVVRPGGMRSFALNRRLGHNPSHKFRITKLKPIGEHARDIAQRPFVVQQRMRHGYVTIPGAHFGTKEEASERLAGIKRSYGQNPYSTAHWKHKDLLPGWRRKIDKRSIRNKTVWAKKGGKRLLRVGCPKGQWMPTVERCRTSLKALSILRPVRKNPGIGRTTGMLVNVVRGK